MSEWLRPWVHLFRNYPMVTWHDTKKGETFGCFLDVFCIIPHDFQIWPNIMNHGSNQIVTWQYLHELVLKRPKRLYNILTFDSWPWPMWTFSRYGSTEAFTRYVRGTLRRELIGCTYMQLKMPPCYLMLICMGPVSASLESLLGLLKLGWKKHTKHAEGCWVEHSINHQ